MVCQMNRSLLLIAGLGIALSANAASAGFVLNTARDFVRSVRVNPAQISIDDPFVTDGFGGFLSYVPDSADDPVIHPLDLETYKYQLNGYVSAVHGNSVTYSGEYSIVIDLRPFGSPDVYISSGTFILTATYRTPTHALITGQLTQVDGPNEGGVFDLTYGSAHPINYLGEYFETDPGLGGELIGEMSQTAPGAGSLTVLLAGAGLGLRRRRIK